MSNPTTDADTHLPVPAETSRTYLHIKPTDDPLSPETITTHVRRLHQLRPEDDHSLLDTLRGATTELPTIEWLLVADAETDTLWYGVGVEEDLLDPLTRILRGCLPDSYELERTQRQLPLHTTDTDPIAALEFVGQPDRPGDWQTRLTPFEDFCTEDTAPPLAAIAETMAAHDCPMVYQALLEPKPDWDHEATDRKIAIEDNRDTLGDRLANAIVGPPDDDNPLPERERRRLEEIEARNKRRSFLVNARLCAYGTATTDADPETVIAELTGAFEGVSHTCYEIASHRPDDPNDTTHAIQNRTVHPPTYEHTRKRLPWNQSWSRGIVADPREVPNFCLLGGTDTAAAGARALSPTPGERTALPRPPVEQLSRYRTPGLLLGQPLTQDGTPDTEPLYVPPRLQPLHVGWFGKTGSGKSTSLINAVLDNQAVTDGADILVDPKGDGMAIDYMRAHYATHGHLDDVLYFDCADVLPALSFFDIRDELDAGVARQTAVEDTVDHYMEILTQIMGRDRFEQAVRSPDVIRYLLKALFDPVNGDDAFGHSDLHAAVRTMHERQTAPAVSDSELERMLAGVVANQTRSFDEIMQGVANRIEKIPVDQRLAQMFDHVPADEEDPHFDLINYLDEDVVIIVDTGSLRSEAQRVVALVVLSNLWTALRRRARRSDDDRMALVNLYLEEAASIAVSDLLQELLAQARGFDCSVTLAMQFPAQLRKGSRDAYDEVLNNVSTLVTGNVPADERLARRLATDEMDPAAVGNRLRALRRGQWLISLPAAFGDTPPRPFLLGSASPPPGDPAGSRPLTEAETDAFDETLSDVHDRTLSEAGLTLAEPSVAEDEPDGDGEDGDDETDTEASTDDTARVRIDSALPHTRRMPPTVAYDASIHALECTECANRYDPDSTGMERAVECCSSLEETDPDDIPICDLHLKLSADEREALDYTDPQLRFLQAVYNAQQLRYSAPEYDLLYDSMNRLREYVAIEPDAIQDLIDAGLLTHDADHPQRLYTVTPDGRSLLGESYRRGLDYGHGAGDLEESSEHVLAVEVGRRYLEAEYAADPDSAVEEVIPYYDLDGEQTLSPAAFMGTNEDVKSELEQYEQRRLDVAGVDSDGSVVVAVEAERVNHDTTRAVPDDFDKIAECGVEEAIWLVLTQSDGHEVLQALNEPADGEPRVEKTYASTTPPQQFQIDTPGLTAMYPVRWLRDRLDES
jgi:DNA helicase HerA-like ATPase